ncbi:polysaccharide biosynthesis tyrosine autokinase [uncultured Jatrophihabitans sp.]|uniref:polysaccharide biosynthesis tyrosine autokinase n=1 Tax=uncultured Jatrophihabitans sp. TaxID=1610747 RepID=UPI0035CCA4EF
MESVNYLRGLVRSWWLILLVVIAGGLGGFVIYEHATPLYRSSIRLVVATTNASDDPASAQALSAAQAQSLAQFATTTPGILDAVKQAGLPNASPSVSAGAGATQPFVSIDVVSPDPQVARRVANAYAVTALRTKNRLSKSSGGVTVTALAPASDPGSPFSPNAKQDIGLGLAVGLVLGIALALLREALNRTVRDSSELSHLLSLKVLGTVPRDMPKTVLPARTHPRSSRAEAYRQIRTSVLNASTRRPLTIAVTSATLGEGKTSVATNLAAVFSRAGHRVALVDADLRRPRVADFYDIDTEYGVSEVLSGEVSLGNALTYFDDGRFAVLTCGRIPANPSEALGSAAMTAVLAELAREFEFVIVDTPPLLPVTDALVLAPNMDGVVFVTRLGHTTRDRVLRAKSIIDRVDANVLGVVANQASKGADSDYRYAYQESGKRRAPGTTVIPTDREIDVTLGPDSPSRHAAPDATAPTDAAGRAARNGSTPTASPPQAETESPGAGL